MSTPMTLQRLFTIAAALLLASCAGTAGGDGAPGNGAAAEDSAAQDGAAQDGAAQDATANDAGATDSDAGSTDSDAGSTDSDAGSTNSDAGSTDSDAGSTGSDAGSTDSDAGSTDSDAGSTDNDAGSTDSDAVGEDASATDSDAEADAGTPEDAGGGCTPVAEVCDGKDNDCDGQIDETDGGPLCKVDSKSFCAGEVCHQGSCQPAGVVGVPCADLNACTGGEACTPGTAPCPPNEPACKQKLPSCMGGKPIACDDKDPCTTDSCDKTKGCVAAPVVCNDNNVCTADSCDKATGCVTSPAEGACSDGSVCTEGDACDAGTCKPGATAKVCDDANVCTSDSCNATGGCVHTKASGGPCSDGSSCTTDVCAAGVCKATTLSCDDKNGCTQDSCDPKTGCVNAYVNGCQTCATVAECDDKNSCSTDSCTGGVCANAAIADCKGSTDYTIAKLVIAQPTFDATAGTSSFSYEVHNPFNIATPTNSTIAFWLSPTDGKGEGAVKIHDFTGPIVGGFTAPNVAKSSLTVNHQLFAPKLPKGPAAMKFACLELTIPTDTVPTNNLTCVAITPHVPDFAVGALTVTGSGAPLEGTAYEFGPAPQFWSADIKSQGTLHAIVDVAHVFYAADNKGKTGVLQIGFAKTLAPNNQLAPGANFNYGYQVAIDKPALPIGPGFACVRAQSVQVPAGWAPTPDDDIACVAITIKKSPDLVMNTIKSPLASSGSGGVPASPGLTLGIKFQCIASVSNVGLSAAAQSKVRCTLKPAGAANPTWTTDIVVSQLPSGGGQLPESGHTTLTPDLVTGAKLGHAALEVCATIDPDNEIAEINETNNTLCHPVFYYAQDLTVIDGQLGTTLSQVKRGVALDVQKFTVKNIGNAGSSQNFAAKILLSTDNTLSADDKVLCGVTTGTPSMKPNDAVALTTFSAFYGGQKCTVPADWALGSAHLIYVVDPDNAVMEFSDANNTLVVPVTIQ